MEFLGTHHVDGIYSGAISQMKPHVACLSSLNSVVRV